jgi:hypothetical protein
MAKNKPTSLTIAPDPALTALKARTTKLLKTWQECQVLTTTDFESAGEGLKTTVQLRKDLKALPVYVELSRQKADIKAKEKVLKDVDKLIESVESTIRDALSAYAAKQRAEQEKLITKALDSGKDEKAALIAAKPFVPEVSGLSFTEHWHAEVSSFDYFVTWCLNEKKLEEFLLPNMVALNARARDLKTEDLGIPGAKGVKEVSSTVRG